MKYEIKRSKIEEIILYLEDGCVIKVTNENIRSLRCSQHHYNACGSYWECVVELSNGITVAFPTEDRELLDGLRQLCDQSVF